MKTPVQRVVALFVPIVAATVLATSCETTDENLLPREQTPEMRRSLTTRSYEEALALAEESIGYVDRGVTRTTSPRRIVGKGQCVTAPSKTRSGQTDTLMYIFNFADNAGFSAIAANRAVQPVLAVTESGNYTYGEPTGVENFDFYMEELSNVLSDFSIIPGGPYDPVNPILPDVKYKTITGPVIYQAPILEVEWGQNGAMGALFSNYCCGCVTTAVAQILTYYEFPESITTTYPDNIAYSGQTIDLDWDAMKLYPETTTSSVEMQLSALCREIGYNVGAFPDGSATAAYSSLVKPFLESLDYTLNGHTDLDIIALRDELSTGHPVYMDGDRYNDEGDRVAGHAWVADGVHYQQKTNLTYTLNKLTGIYTLTNISDFSTKLIHYNWGWDGSYNGNFILLDEVTVGSRTYETMGMYINIRKPNEF